MTRLQALERQIEELPPGELAEFRDWFAEFEAASWDRQFEQDVQAGRLDDLAERALQAHAAGKTTRL